MGEPTLREAAQRVVDLLHDGLLGTLGFYAGPNARTAVDSGKAAKVTALGEAARDLRAALAAALREDSQPARDGLSETERGIARHAIVQANIHLANGDLLAVHEDHKVALDALSAAPPPAPLERPE